MCYWLAILRDDRANLLVTGIGVHVKGFVKVRVSEKRVLSYVLFDVIEGLLF